MYKHYIGVSILAIFIVIISLISFMLAGFPGTQKGIQSDQIRINSFKNISYAIESYANKNNKLPNSLSDVDIPTYVTIKDPESQKQYEYKKIKDSIYSLCTEFSFSSDEFKNKKLQSTYVYTKGINENHKKGYDCIQYNLPDYIKNNIDDNNSEPSASLISIKKTGDCKWVISFKVKGIDTKQPVLIEASGKITNCSSNVSVPFSWTQERDLLSSNVVSYIHEDYGTYTYAVTDKNNKKAALTFDYQKDTISKP